MLYKTGILFFVLILRYGCSRVMFVSRSKELENNNGLSVSRMFYKEL